MRAVSFAGIAAIRRRSAAAGFSPAALRQRSAGSAGPPAGGLAEGDGPITSGSSRVLRGGSWNNESANLRSANRNDNTPDNRNNNIGFRVVCELE
ncbi:MAG TPA: hypothetical protein DCX79_14795 [Planctomycetaceae bacterium]|nr:hypothetical protein [Planctomycetaceae bacterium]